MAESGTYTPETIARRMKMAEALLGDPKKPVTHWAEGLNELAKGYFGGKLYSDAEKSEKDNESAQSAALLGMLGGGQEAGPTTAPSPAPSGGPVSYTDPANDPTVGGAMPGGYGKNTVTADNGEAMPMPPQNPLGQMTPDFRSKFADLRGAAADKGAFFDAPAPGSLGGVRTPEIQEKLFAQGRTAPGNIVTNTLNSNHLTGNAMDVVPRGSSPGQIGSVVAALTKDPQFSGMRSGATFKGLYDPLHVEMNKPGNTVVASNDPSIGLPSQDAPQNSPPQAAPPSAPPMQMAQAGGDTRGKIVEMLNSPNPAVRKMGRSLATGLVGKMLTPADYDIQQRPDGTVIAVNKKNPQDMRVINAPGAGQSAIKFEADKAAAVAKAKGEAEKSVGKEQRDTEAKQQANIVVQDIDRALDLTSKQSMFSPVTGLTGSMASSVPGTRSHDVLKLVETVKANAGFDALQKMRNNSPTGGALGQVSEREIAYLQSTIGNLEQSQNDDQFKDNLRRVKNAYLDIIHGPGNGPREKLDFQSKGNKASGKTKSGLQWSVE